MTLRPLSRLADLPKKFMLFEWKGHGLIEQKVNEFKKKFGYRPSHVFNFKDCYFVETKNLAPVAEKI